MRLLLVLAQDFIWLFLSSQSSFQFISHCKGPLPYDSNNQIHSHTPMFLLRYKACDCWYMKHRLKSSWDKKSVLMIACTLHRRPFRFDLIWWSIGRIFAQPSHSGESLMWKWLQLFVSYVPTVSQAFIITYTLSSFCHYCPSITSLLHWVSALSIW